MQYARLRDDPRAAIAAALDGEALGLAVETSGSTGAPREVLLPREAIVASSDATRERLGGAGNWLLALPPERIGGALVVARSRLDLTELVTLPAGPFTPKAFAAAAADLPAVRRYTSLVPTQVVRLARSAEGRAALASFDAVLVGGAPLPQLGLDANVVSTYGATETCGGCIYDGVPLAGVRVAVEDGVVRLGGPTIAAGYADGEGGAFVIDGDGVRWFTTPDAGAWDGAHLTIEGRADDVIITGGLKAHPSRVERALESLPSIPEAAVAGVADAEWGQRVVAWVVPHGAAPDLEDVREALAALLEPHELPRELVPAISLPRGPGGKIDRPALRALAAALARKESPSGHDA